jgi:hypothetical protein
MAKKAVPEEVPVEVPVPEVAAEGEERQKNTFTLFAPDGKGRKTDNAPCVVEFPEMTAADFSAEEFAALIEMAAKILARKKYAAMNAGYEQLETYLQSARDIMTATGAQATPEKIREVAVLLAAREKKSLAFEPVTSLQLSISELKDLLSE